MLIEIKEANPLFDISLWLESSHVASRGKVETTINMINIGDSRQVDVLLYYAIKDFDGNVLSFREESLAVEKQLTVKRELNAPDYSGRYIFYAKVIYGNQTASSSEAFSVEPKVNLNIQIIAILIGLIIIVLLIILIMRYILKRSMHKRKSK